MIIHIKRREDPFARIDKKVLDDRRLSWGATGLLAYLLSKPATWKVRVGHLESISLEGRDAIRSLFKELKSHGYAVLNNTAQGSEWTIFEEPPPENPSPDIQEPLKTRPLSKNEDMNSKNEEVTPSKKGKLSDEDFIEAIRPNYPGVDIDREIGKMNAWLLTPRGSGRKLTRQFMVNWLNKCDTTIKSNGTHQSTGSRNNDNANGRAEKGKYSHIGRVE